MDIVIRTRRLNIRMATVNDGDLFYDLWTTPEVMEMVGYPNGLKITREEVYQLLKMSAAQPLDAKLVVETNDRGTPIGGSQTWAPDAHLVSTTDIKLFPEYWGNGYGREIKQALVDWLFTNTNCQRIKATPNKLNIASQRMQEAVGARLEGEMTWQFPERMKDHTVDLELYVYVVHKEDWVRSRRELQVW